MRRGTSAVGEFPACLPRRGSRALAAVVLVSGLLVAVSSTKAGASSPAATTSAVTSTTSTTTAAGLRGAPTPTSATPTSSSPTIAVPTPAVAPSPMPHPASAGSGPPAVHPGWLPPVSAMAPCAAPGPFVPPDPKTIPSLFDPSVPHCYVDPAVSGVTVDGNPVTTHGPLSFHAGDGYAPGSSPTPVLAKRPTPRPAQSQSNVRSSPPAATQAMTASPAGTFTNGILDEQNPVTAPYWLDGVGALLETPYVSFLGGTGHSFNFVGMETDPNGDQPNAPNPPDYIEAGSDSTNDSSSLCWSNPGTVRVSTQINGTNHTSCYHSYYIPSGQQTLFETDFFEGVWYSYVYYNGQNILLATFTDASLDNTTDYPLVMPAYVTTASGYNGVPYINSVTDKNLELLEDYSRTPGGADRRWNLFPVTSPSITMQSTPLGQSPPVQPFCVTIPPGNSISVSDCSRAVTSSAGTLNPSTDAGTIMSASKYLWVPAGTYILSVDTTAYATGQRYGLATEATTLPAGMYKWQAFLYVTIYGYYGYSSLYNTTQQGQQLVQIQGNTVPMPAGYSTFEAALSAPQPSIQSGIPVGHPQAIPDSYTEFADPAAVVNQSQAGSAGVYGTGPIDRVNMPAGTWTPSPAANTFAAPHDALPNLGSYVHPTGGYENWAPTVRYLNGQYVMWFSPKITSGSHCLLEATSPTVDGAFTPFGSPYCDQNFDASHEHSPATNSTRLIDPSLFVDPVSHNVYLSWSRQWQSNGGSEIVSLQVAADGSIPSTAGLPIPQSDYTYNQAVQALQSQRTTPVVGDNAYIENPQYEYNDNGPAAAGIYPYDLYMSLGTYSETGDYHTFTTTTAGPPTSTLSTYFGFMIDAVLEADVGQQYNLDNPGSMSLLNDSVSPSNPNYLLFSAPLYQQQPPYGYRKAYSEVLNATGYGLAGATRR